MGTKVSEIAYPVRERLLTFDKPLVMGIINLTPDSFYDGGKYSGPADACRDAAGKIEDGAQILDLGAASSRPGAPEISETEEWARLQPALTLIRNEHPRAFISVDTYRASVAERAADAGADMINDISGGTLDPNMFATIARLGLPYVLMHMPGDPRTMAKTPPYKNVVSEVLSELLEKAKLLEIAGHSRIILDPGFGFGKSLENNYQLLRGLEKFTSTGYPVMAGISRKSMISRVAGTNPVTALTGTTALNTIALLNGASILRVHDVAEAMQVVRLVSYYKEHTA